MWDSHKALFGLFKKQEARIDFLFGRQSRLDDLLRKALVLTGDDESAPPPTLDPETIAKVEAGMAELEKMFNPDDKQSEGTA
jgi:hypothetical protein